MTSESVVETQSLQVLIAEDEIVIARDIEDSLKNLGYEVVAIASSGREAVTKAREHQPQIILMDIRLDGDMDGIQAAEQIWNTLQIPVIYVTGFSDKSTLERAKRARPFGYVLKPVEERELYVAIETALQQYQTNRILKDREQWLATVLQDMGDGVIVADLAGRVRLVNSVAEALTGWSQGEAEGKDVSDIFPLIRVRDRTTVESTARIALQHDSIVYLSEPVLLVARNGVEIPIGDSASPLRDHTGSVTGVVIVFRDLSQRWLVEERNLALDRARQLELEMQELERLSQLKDDFLSMVSHELRTPLANMKMAIQMLEIVLGQQGVLSTDNTSSDRTARYIQILRNQCNQELNLVNDLLNLQQLNINAYSLVPSLIRLHDWIPNLAEQFQERIRENNQHLVLDLLELPSIQTDEPSLARILSELLNNACKYTPAGETISVVLRPLSSATLINQIPRLGEESELTMPVRSPNYQVMIQVNNTGVEIPPTELPNVFEQFYRIPQSDLRNQGGTGLGLSLVQKLVQHLGGSIRAESQPGQTSFTVELPTRLIRDR